LELLESEHVKSDLGRADARRSVKRILRAAAALFAISPTPTVERIAERAGASTSSVYRHFSTKRDIYAATLDMLLYDLRLPVLSRLDTWSLTTETVGLLTDSFFDVLDEARPLIENLILSLDDRIVAHAFDRHRTALIDGVAEILEASHGASFPAEHRRKTESACRIMEDIVLEYVRAAPEPSSAGRYRNLFSYWATHICELLADARAI